MKSFGEVKKSWNAGLIPSPQTLSTSEEIPLDLRDELGDFKSSWHFGPPHSHILQSLMPEEVGVVGKQQEFFSFFFFGNLWCTSRAEEAAHRQHAAEPGIQPLPLRVHHQTGTGSSGCRWGQCAPGGLFQENFMGFTSGTAPVPQS